MLRLRLTAVLLLSAWLWPPAAAAQGAAKRCVAADGSVVFTDRECSDAIETAALPGGILTADDEALLCARSPEQMLARVQTALTGSDGNRLAALFNWSGHSNGSARARMDEFEAIATAAMSTAQLEADTDPVWDKFAGKAGKPGGNPGSLRLEYAPAVGDTARVRVFRLRVAAGCLWLSD